MISVIIPARNAAATIAATLASLAGDRERIGEILLIDDGSQDDTVASANAAATLHGLPLKVVAVDLGNAGAARNAGLDRAEGKYIFFLDADDEVRPGGLRHLAEALDADGRAGLAVGASIHRGRVEKLKLPGRYGAEPRRNAQRYLANRIRSITVGSALVTAEATAGVRFPERIGLDEDTIYWAAILTRSAVARIEKPVLIYNLDEGRMAQRFLSNPRGVFLKIAQDLNRLRDFGVEKPVLQARKAFIAQRIARHLIKRRRYPEAYELLRIARMHGGIRHRLKSLEYRAKIALGRMMAPPVRSGPDGDAPPKGIGAAMRTVVLTADPANPPVSGADLRNFGNARALARHGEVTLVSLNPLSAAPSDFGIPIRALTRADDVRGRAERSWRTSIEARATTTSMQRLRALIRQLKPDAVVIEGIPLFAAVEHVRPLVSHLAIDMHNVESMLARQNGDTVPGRLRSRLDAWRIERIERRALAMADSVWVCSDLDRQRIARLLPTDIPVHVVPNGIPGDASIPSAIPPLPSREEGWPVMLFVGHLGYRPNVIAAERLAQGILPLIRQRLPAARVLLAGRRPDPAVRRLAELPGVDLTPDPEALTGLFRRAHLSVTPLTAGGGTRIKILEAMAWGLPVAATPVAAEGLDFDADEILLGDSDDEIADRIVALCAAPERMETQRMKAHAKAMRLYGPAAIAAAVDRACGVST